MATGGAGQQLGTRHRQAARSGRRLFVPMVSGVAVGAVALAFVIYTLWPSWPKAPAATGVPHLPIVIAGETFHVPPDAIRMAVQRHPGPQDRIDLVYTWPALVPPPATPTLKQTSSGIALQEGRLFVSIMPKESPTDPVERFRTIYLRYAATERQPAPEGLVLVAFRDATPYQGEDLAYDERAPERFIVRCARSEHKLAPATCLYERYAGEANITIRFPRDLLSEWRALADGFDRLIADLHPHAAG
jgi:hypothetical protein